MPTARPATCPLIGRPSALARAIHSRISGQRGESGPVSPSMSENDSGRPERATKRRMQPKASSASSSKSMMSCIAPRPASFSASAIAVSSASAARKVGVDWPSLERWKNVLDVENPIAPASTASRTRRAISARSAALAGAPLAPRSPIA